jgi:hypothetical protein
MSMTQVAIFSKDKLPNLSKIEEDIQNLGYNLKFSDTTSQLLSGDGIECFINGHKTYFETYIDEPKNLKRESKFIQPDIENEDTALSFVWGADFAAGASIGLISIALIDNCNAKIYYLDDEMKYTRQMLIDDTPQFLEELNKQKISLHKSDPNKAPNMIKKKKGFISNDRA